MKSYRRLLQFVAPYKGRLIAALLCTLMGALFNSFSIAMIGPVFDKILSKPSPEQAASFLHWFPPFVVKHLSPDFINSIVNLSPEKALHWIPLIISITMLLKGLFNYLGEVLNNEVCYRLAMDIRNALFAKLHDLPLSYHSQQRGGQVISRFTNDVGIMPVGIFDVFSRVIGSGANIIGLSLLIFAVNWRLALLVMVIFPVAIGPLIHFGRRLRRHSTEGQERMADVVSVLHESMAGVRVIKAFGLESLEIKKIKDALYGHFRALMRQTRASALSGPVMEFIGGGLGLPLLFFIAGNLVLQQKLTVGEFVTFIGAIASLYPQVKNISGVNNSIQNAMAATDRVFDVLDTASNIQDAPNAFPLPPMRESLEFKNISFHYVASTPVLEQVNLRIKAGQMIALVGPSGAGKTTLADLVPRFYDPTQGSLLLDGKNIRQATLASLREQIGIVSQETFLFNDSIAANIAYGRRGASQAEIEASARAANAHDFILAQPQGYQTLIGERGARLSGGQRQRLAIARAILKNPPILILDEATSALDTESERLVQAAMDQLMEQRTTLVIAHRLSTVKHADAIVVLEQGRVVETGRHEELLAKGGLYARLYHLQFEKADDKKEVEDRRQEPV